MIPEKIMRREIDPSRTRPLRWGAIGLGRGFMLMRQTFSNDPRCLLVAGMDPRIEARDAFEQEFSAPTYKSVEDLCANESVEVVYLGSPHQWHAEQAVICARHGKHVLVDKPMALDLADCSNMIEACDRYGVSLIAGPSHGFDAPVIQASSLIESGQFGSVRMITAVNFTDFLYRPRRPEELNTDQGGGVVFSQGSHHVDVVRRLAGAPLRSVRAAVGRWDPTRPADGAYQALLNFENDVTASITYSGYGHYDTDALQDWISETGKKRDSNDYGAARRRLAGGSEADLKNKRAYGSRYANDAPAISHEHFGFIVASCDHADLHIRATGLDIYADDRHWTTHTPMRDATRATVIDEVWAAITQGVCPLHDGRWGAENLAACLAILRSGTEHREVSMSELTGK